MLIYQITVVAAFMYWKDEREPLSWFEMPVLSLHVSVILETDFFTDAHFDERQNTKSNMGSLASQLVCLWKAVLLKTQFLQFGRVTMLITIESGCEVV